MRKVVKVVGLVLGGLATCAAGFVLVSFGPRNVWGLLRYDQRQEGELAVGGAAPDVVLTALDGKSQVHLGQLWGQRPTVLVFGSYT